MLVVYTRSVCVASVRHLAAYSRVISKTRVRYYSNIINQSDNDKNLSESKESDVARYSNFKAGVLESEIKQFIVEAGVMSDRIRTPQEQLQCIGGTAFSKSEYHIKQLYCKNIGLDAHGKVMWQCVTPALHNKVSLGQTRVTFEGARGPGDKLVRPGSEVVRYHLDLKAAENYETFNIIAIVIVFIIVVIFINSLISIKDTRVQSDVPNTIRVVHDSPKVVHVQADPKVVYDSPKIVHVQAEPIIVQDPPEVIIQSEPIVVRDFSKYKKPRKTPKQDREYSSVVYPSDTYSNSGYSSSGSDYSSSGYSSSRSEYSGSSSNSSYQSDSAPAMVFAKTGDSE